MGKAEQNKQTKKDSLLDTGFNLFTSKGFSNTSISDIVTNAGVAKGTFYLYFKDKYDLRNKLIAHKANTILLEASDSLKQQDISDFTDQIIYITDYIIHILEKDTSLLMLISKHLSWGIFTNTLCSVHAQEDPTSYSVIFDLLTSSGLHFRDPEVMIYMIIETISGSIYNPILYNQPLPLDDIMPYIHSLIRSIVAQHIIE